MLQNECLRQIVKPLLLMQMFLLRPVKAGESISISYGDLLNDFLLLDYGAHCLQRTCSIPTPSSFAALCVIALLTMTTGSAGFIIADNPHDRVNLRFDLRLVEAAMAVSTVWHTKLALALRLPSVVHHNRAWQARPGH